MKMNYLRFNDDGNLLLTMFDKDYVITNLDEWEEASAEIVANELFPEYGQLTCASGIDWPHDETDDQDLIDICNAVRGNSV